MADDKVKTIRVVRRPDKLAQAEELLYELQCLIHVTRDRLTAEQRLTATMHAMRLAYHGGDSTIETVRLARKFVTAVIRGTVDPDDYPTRHPSDLDDRDGADYEADPQAEPEDHDDYYDYHTR